jgi:type II secretory pathway component PulJ
MQLDIVIISGRLGLSNWGGRCVTAKEYLKQAFILNRLIKAKKSRIRELRDMMEYTGAALADVKVQASLKSDPMGDLAAKLLDSISDCQRDIARLLDLQCGIETIINAVERDEYRLVLYERYINLKNWDDVAADNGYSEKHVFKLHGQALLEVKLDTK